MAVGLFERLTRRSARDQQTAATTFDELILQTLDNEMGVDESKAAEILKAACKTTDDLAAAVDLQRQRRAWATACKAASEAQKRLSAIEQRFQEIAAETIDARTRLAAEERDLSDERYELGVVVAGGDEAAGRLRETCDAEMKAKDRGLREQKRKLLAKRRTLLQQLNLPANGERNTSADLRTLKQNREYVLRRQKEGVTQGNRNLLGDVKPLVDQLRTVDAKITDETKRITPVWKTIEGLDKEIAKLDIESKKLTAEKLEVA